MPEAPAPPDDDACGGSHAPYETYPRYHSHVYTENKKREEEKRKKEGEGRRKRKNDATNNTIESNTRKLSNLRIRKIPTNKLKPKQNDIAW